MLRIIMHAARVGIIALTVLISPLQAASNGFVETLLAARDAVKTSQPVQESAWHATASIKANFKDELFPEKGIRLDAIENGKKLWQSKDFPNGVVHPLKGGDGTATYLFRTIKSESAGPMEISLGSDDGLEFWFNGEKLLSKDAPRGVAPNQDRVKVRLKAGDNAVLLKIYNRSGDSGFYYNTDLSRGGALADATSSFPSEVRKLRRIADLDAWFASPDQSVIEQQAIEGVLSKLTALSSERAQLTKLVQEKAGPKDPRWLNLMLHLADRSETFRAARERLLTCNPEALRRAVVDLSQTFPSNYSDGAGIFEKIDAFEKGISVLEIGLAQGNSLALAQLEAFESMKLEALRRNPLLDFEKLILVRRREGNLGLPQNWQGNSSLNPSIDNEIATLPLKSDGALQTLYKPKQNLFVGDVDLHFDGGKLLFSSIGAHGRWQIFEIGTDGSGLRQVTPSDESDIDSYDAIYLPDGRIIFDSTSTFQGVPCVGGADYVANLNLMNADGTGIRRLCFDQDNDWYPVLLPSGRVMYLRWEYTDSAHYFSRVLMTMNPDGTGQTEMYHSNSYWPNGLWYARPLPGSSTKFVAVISGHHGVPRMGELVLFDVSKGRSEDTGAIQRIPGFGKPVKGIIKDSLVDDSWPKFLHPFPLSDKYFLVSCKPSPSSAWGIYLVDVFDNMVLIKEEPGYALFEPMPLRKSERPPMILDRVKLSEKDATVYVHDIYAGPGLRGVPPGTVKNLRVFQYEYSYRNQGGHYFIGMESGWDVRRMIGTVPVEADGSAMFKIPANTPVALQPLDEEGKALQQMRSWFVGMPGEYVSCAGCHEPQNSTAALGLGIAARKPPVVPEPWKGPKRGFSFVREVQPVLDRYCAGCHKGDAAPNLADATVIPTSGGISPLPKSYLALHPYIRRNGPEGDYHTLTPLEFHANTSLLLQILRKGHYNVKLDEEAMDRLVTWIDLNVPAYGTFHEAQAIPGNNEKRRYDSKIKYAGLAEDIEAIPDAEPRTASFIAPPPVQPRPAPLTLAGWPFASDRARGMQQALGENEMTLELGNKTAIRLKKIPAGEFVMGDVDGYENEFPASVIRIRKPYWMGATEITLEQFQQFDPNHQNGYYDMHYKDQVKPGYLMDEPGFPVIRISWQQALAFCEWLSARTGKKVTLPTEAQWEWACRSGTSTPMNYGGLDSDFSLHANLADASLSKMAVIGVDPQPIHNPDKFWDYLPKEARFNDGSLHLAQVGQFRPNAWGLHDMIGNVGEWVLDDYRPYPYSPPLEVKDSPRAIKTVRGGSWADRPKESRSSARWDYPAWQRVYNVGFRIVVLDEAMSASN